jgi:hypothetical protein
MTGNKFCETAHDDDTFKVSTLLTTQDTESFINYLDAQGDTPLFLGMRPSRARGRQREAPCISL